MCNFHFECSLVFVLSTLLLRFLKHSCLPDKSGPPLICVQNYKIPIQTYSAIALFNPSRCLIRYSLSNFYVMRLKDQGITACPVVLL